MARTLLVLLNTLSFIAVLIFNALAGSGNIANNSVGEVSRQYDSLFAPAGYAFSIWGLIYLMLASFVAFQWYELIKKKDYQVIEKTGLFFFVSNLANAGWILLWVNGYIGLSLIPMLVLLSSLIALVFRLQLEIYDATVRVIFFVWWPFAVYLGWIMVATIANAAAFFTALNWEANPLSPQVWTIVMIMVAAGLYLLIIYTRNLRESAVVGVWAFIAIAVRQYDINPEISITAILASAVLAAAALYHGYKNKSSSPFNKLRRGEF